jgi:hypothetical protein
MIFTPVVMAEPASSQEAKLKVGFIYNFIKLTQPVKPMEETYHLCMVGNSSLNENLIRLNQQVAHGKQIEVISLFPNSNSLKNCDSLFIGNIAKKRQLLTIIDHAISQKVLTISDSKYSLDEGVIINLKQLGGRIRFDVNLTAAQQSQLILNANLLRLAHNVLK